MNKIQDLLKREYRHPLAHIAFWQLLGFMMLLCVVWVCEASGILSACFKEPWASYFKESLSDSGLARATVISIGITICAIVIIGNTFVQQKRIISGFLIICSYCKRVRLNTQDWQKLETYVAKHSKATFSHGMCPDCYAKINEEMAKPHENKQSTDSLNQ
jgi:hypothetical protein